MGASFPRAAGPAYHLAPREGNGLGVTRKTMQGVLIVAAAVGFVLLMWLGNRWANSGGHDSESVWAQVARERGATIGRTEEPLGGGQPTLRWTTGPVTVVLESYSTIRGGHADWHTRARAPFAAGTGPSFDVRPSGLTDGVAGQDLELGRHPEFDAAFRVRFEDRDAARRVWTAPAQRRLLEHLPEARVESDGRQVTIVVDATVRERAQVEAMLDLAAELARASR